jgi:hypothetical protein
VGGDLGHLDRLAQAESPESMDERGGAAEIGKVAVEYNPRVL